jgi:hypothetical protein
VFQKHLSYANIIASVALFVALGGTAAAAATLTRDSVGAPQIRKDAVRSPEIQKDAVRSPEIQKDAVRTSEIRNESITLTDVAPGAATALRGKLHVAENDNNTLDAVPACNGDDLSVCPNFVALELASGTGSRAVEPGPSEPASNWLVQAKTDVVSIKEVSQVNRCGLVSTEKTGRNAVLDEVRVREDEDIALSAVVKRGAGNPTIALRCTSQDAGAAVDVVIPIDVKLTALEVGSVTGP